MRPKYVALFISMLILIMASLAGFSQDRNNMPGVIDLDSLKASIQQQYPIYDSLKAVVTYNHNDGSIRTDTCMLYLEAKGAEFLEDFGQFNSKCIPLGATLINGFCIVPRWHVKYVYRFRNGKSLYRKRIIHYKLLEHEKRI